MERLDLDSLFLILNNLSYKDLYNFPKLNKFYKTLEQNPYYLQLLSKRKSELCEQFRDWFSNYLKNMIEYVGVSVKIEFDGIILWRSIYDGRGIIYRKSMEDIDIDISQEQAKTIIYEKLKNGGNIKLIMQVPVNVNLKKYGEFNYWVDYDPNSVKVGIIRGHSTFKHAIITINPSEYFSRYIKKYCE